jgi:pimeloyl-ACP methyl ester carboxylesterase
MSAPNDGQLFYTVDDFTDPWREADAVVLLHGNSESGEAWRAWVPHLARDYKVIRPDVRGFGRSKPMPAEFPWSMDVLVDDLGRLASTLGLKSFHLIAAKLGGTMALKFAAVRPDLVRSLCVIGVPASPAQSFNASLPGWVDEMQRNGVRSWAASTMRARLGSKASAGHIKWWTDLMGATALSTQQGFMKMVAKLDVTPDLPNIKCPTLVVTTADTAMWSVDSTEAWRKRIPNSELVVLQSDSYHIAGAEPDEVARRVRPFIDRNSSSPGKTASLR